MRQLGGLLVVLFVSSSAFATTWEENDSFWVSYNFSANAFDKTVQSVFAHTGVLRQGGDSCGFPISPYPGSWDDAQDVRMTRVGDHFFGKARLDSHTGECQVGVAGPIVQYWITFTDGTTKVTDSSTVPFIDTSVTIESQGSIDWDTSAKANDKAFEATTDATKTAAIRLHYAWAD